LPIDCDEPNKILTHSEISAIMTMSRARHKLVIADACHSGALSQAKGVETIYEAYRQIDSGFALFLSSRKEEKSWENSKLEGGVFSYYLREGLQGPADSNGDNIVTIQELYDYVKDPVKRYTFGTQTPVLKGNYDPNMPIGILR
jgi:uncharacterized caspase-like protein